DSIRVADTLPAGLSFVSASGAGWNFWTAGAVVHAAHATPIAAGDSLVFTLTVAAAPAAVPGVTNTATVTTTGDVNAANNTATDPTVVNGVPDLAMDKRHTVGFQDGVNGTYTLVMTNVGSAATTDTIAVTDVLPAGLGFVSGAGAGW